MRLAITQAENQSYQMRDVLNWGRYKKWVQCPVFERFRARLGYPKLLRFEWWTRKESNLQPVG